MTQFLIRRSIDAFEVRETRLNEQSSLKKKKKGVPTRKTRRDDGISTAIKEGETPLEQTEL